MTRHSRHDGLDGLRAVAVALVVAYHLDVPGLRGGFVGVDVFFVVSGYLITTLLLSEQARHGDVRVGDFLRRRARRLWPLAWTVLGLVAVAGAVGVWNADQRRALPAETLAAFAQVANWQQAVGGGYVRDLVAPSPLRHFWSLAIEEQFYLAWPLVIVGAARLARRRSTDADRVLAAVLAALAAVSVASGFLMDASWAYLSTVTRMVALVAGAALALVWRQHPLEAPAGGRRWLVGLGAAGAVALTAVAVLGRPEQEWLRHGGFGLVALAATAVVAAVVAGTADRVLATRAVLWTGRRSYAIYLLHWPLIVALGPARPLWVRVLVVVPVTAAAAAVAHRWLEEPVRLQRWRPVALAVAAPLLLTGTAAALWAGNPRTATAEEQVAATLDRVADGAAPGGAVPEPAPAPTTTPPTAPSTSTASEPAPSTAPPSTSAPPPSAAAPQPPLPPAPVPTPSTAPVTTVPAPVTSAPCATSRPRPRAYGPTDLFDPSTVDDVADPDGTACTGTRKVLVVGDSMARGLANGLADVGDPRLRLWDRSEIGCSFEGPGCPNWRTAWRTAVDQIDPDVVVLHTNVRYDLTDLRGPDFLSPDGDARRVALFTEAYRLLGSRGAVVAVDLPTVPLRPTGLFYCRGQATRSACDPRYVAAWTRSMGTAAGATGAHLLDVPTWAAARAGTFRRDRPDGVHFVGPALDALARWVGGQLVALR